MPIALLCSDYHAHAVHASDGKLYLWQESGTCQAVEDSSLGFNFLTTETQMGWSSDQKSLWILRGDNKRPNGLIVNHVCLSPLRISTQRRVHGGTQSQRCSDRSGDREDDDNGRAQATQAPILPFQPEVVLTFLGEPCYLQGGQWYFPMGPCPLGVGTMNDVGHQLLLPARRYFSSSPDMIQDEASLLCLGLSTTHVGSVFLLSPPSLLGYASLTPFPASSSLAARSHSHSHSHSHSLTAVPGGAAGLGIVACSTGMVQIGLTSPMVPIALM